MKKLLFFIVYSVTFITYSQGEVFHYKSVQDVNLRASSTIKSNVVKVVKKGAKLKVIDSTNNWYKVIDNSGSIGHISKDFITKEILIQDDSSNSNDINLIQNLTISVLLLIITLILYFLFKRISSLLRSLDKID